MPHASEAQLLPLQPLLRQLRDIPGLREVKPGIFYCRGAAFLHFHHDADSQQLLADLKKPGGRGFDRYPLDGSPAQRKLLDDSRRRASRNDDD